MFLKPIVHSVARRQVVRAAIINASHFCVLLDRAKTATLERAYGLVGTTGEKS